MTNQEKITKRHELIRKIIKNEPAMVAAEILHSLGYCCVSRRHGTLSRIDNPSLKNAFGVSQDYHRRCTSIDKIDVSRDIAKHVTSSGSSNIGYIDIDEAIEMYVTVETNNDRL
jgi:hypothetical protein